MAIPDPELSTSVALVLQHMITSISDITKHREELDKYQETRQRGDPCRRPMFQMGKWLIKSTGFLDYNCKINAFSDTQNYAVPYYELSTSVAIVLQCVSPWQKDASVRLSTRPNTNQWV